MAAQDKLEAVKNNPLLNHLFHAKTQNIQIGNCFDDQRFIPITHEFISRIPQTLVKDSNGLYLTISSTGRLYKAIRCNQDSMYFKRLDSTHFYGYNASALFFSYRDTLYNFGGSGFWKTNGHLRYYSPYNREWNIKLLNKEFPAVDMLFFLNWQKGILYYTGNDKNYSERESINTGPVVRLNLNTLENELLGNLNPFIYNSISSATYQPRLIPAPGLNGIVVIISYYHQFLFDFERNRIYKLRNLGIRDLFYGNSRGQIASNCFFEDSTLYYTVARDSTYKLYQTKITRNDFEADGIPLYIQPFNWQLWGGLGLAATAAFLALFTRRKKLVKHNPSSANVLSSILFNEEEAEQSNQYTEGELELIRFIHKATLARKYGSVEDINNLLGMGKKTIEVQKKIRTEAISRINHKFKILTGSDQSLVERIRSEEDRRYQKYMIRTENMERLNAVI